MNYKNTPSLLRRVQLCRPLPFTLYSVTQARPNYWQDLEVQSAVQSNPNSASMMFMVLIVCLLHLPELNGEKHNNVPHSKTLCSLWVPCLKSALFCSTGAQTNRVVQTPPLIIKRTGESVVSGISCSHKITDYQTILWYKQDEHKALKLLGYVFLDSAYPEDDVKEKISFNGDGRKQSNLSISDLLLKDSGVYFCAASYHSAAHSLQVSTKTSFVLRLLNTCCQPPFKPA